MDKNREALVGALTQFMVGWQRLEESAHQTAGKAGGEEAGTRARAYETLVDEMHQVLTTLLEREPYSTEELAGAMSCLIDALEEIDPDLFASQDEEDGEADEDEDDDEFDDDLFGDDEEEEEEEKDDERE